MNGMLEWVKKNKLWPISVCVTPLYGEGRLWILGDQNGWTTETGDHLPHSDIVSYLNRHHYKLEDFQYGLWEAITCDLALAKVKLDTGREAFAKFDVEKCIEHWESFYYQLGQAIKSNINKPPLKVIDNDAQEDTTGAEGHQSSEE